MATTARNVASPQWGMKSGAALTLALALLVMLNYADRGALAIAAPKLKTELALSATGFGIAVSAFAWTYAPAQLLVGWLSDRFSVYRMVAAGLAIWALATTLTSFVSGLALLVALRVILGIGEGVAFPAASKIIAAKVSGEHRGIANAVVASCIYFGPALGIFAGGLIMVHYGWRMVFLAFGLITALWLVPWIAVSRPHWRERGAQTDMVPLRVVARHRAAWAMGIGHFLNTYGHFFLLAWLPLFLVKSRGLAVIDMTRLLTAVYLTQAVSVLLCGWGSDWLVARGIDEGRLRKGLVAGGLTLSGIAVLGVGMASDIPHITFWLFFAAIAASPVGANVYAISQMFAGPRASGSWVGLVNGIGNLSGIVGPILTGLIVDRTGSYLNAFYIAGAMGLAGGLWWSLVIPKVRLIDD